MRAQQRVVQQVDDAQAVAVDLVLVGWPYSPACCPDGLAARRGFGGKLDHAVIRQNHLRAVGDEELSSRRIICRKACVFELLDFGEEGRGVEHDAIADNALAAGAQHAAGDELQHNLFAVDDDRVAGVVPAGITRDDVELFREDVDDLAFALVAPLGTEDHGGLAFR